MSSSIYTAAALSVVYYILTVSTITKVSSFSSPRGTTLQIQPQSFISSSVNNAYQYNIISSSRYKSTTRRRGHNNLISSLKSSIEDTIETSDSEGGDSIDKEETLLFNSASDAAKANIDVISSGGNSVASIEGSSTKQQQIQDVLSSPELLDPASILDATIGNTLPPPTTKQQEEVDVEIEVPVLATNLFDTALDTAASMEDPSTSENTISTSSTAEVASETITTPPSTSDNAVAKSKEEDLELTRLAILKHINRYDLSMNQFDNDDDDLDELGETAQYLDNLQPNIQFEKDIDKLSEIQVTKKPTEKLTAPSIQKILRYTIPGKSALVLFYCVLWCVQYEDSAIRILHLNLVCIYVIAFCKPLY